VIWIAEVFPVVAPGAILMAELLIPKPGLTAADTVTVAAPVLDA
jgi:hypothetical protein